MTRRPLTIQRGAQHPHEVWLLGTCALIGASGLLVPARSGAVSEAFPGHLSLLWYIGLLVGSTIASFGVWRGAAFGLLVERGGLVALSGWCFAYGIGALAYAGLPGVPAGLMVAGFGAANLARARQIRRDLDRVQRANAHPHLADPSPLAEADGGGA